MQVGFNQVKIINKLFLLILALLYPFIFLMKFFNLESISKYSIPVLILLIFFNSITRADKSGNRKALISLALFFAFVGDCLINLTTVPQFCVIFFSLTHVCLSYYYFKLKPLDILDWLKLIPVLIICSVFFFFVSGFISREIIKLVLAGYLSVLTLMVWRALCLFPAKNEKLKVKRILMGSVLFYITDLVVCL